MEDKCKANYLVEKNITSNIGIKQNKWRISGLVRPKGDVGRQIVTEVLLQLL
jgi:hypothetical protein